MGREDTVRRFFICIACLCILKIVETWLLGTWLAHEEEAWTKIREPLVSHPRFVLFNSPFLALLSLKLSFDLP